MCLNHHNEEKFVFRFKKFYHLRKKKFCIFQGLIQGPLDPKLTTLPLDHGVSSEVRKKKLVWSLCNGNLLMAGNSRNSKFQKL